MTDAGTERKPERGARRAARIRLEKAIRAAGGHGLSIERRGGDVVIRFTLRGQTATRPAVGCTRTLAVPRGGERDPAFVRVFVAACDALAAALEKEE